MTLYKQLHMLTSCKTDAILPVCSWYQCDNTPKLPRTWATLRELRKRSQRSTPLATALQLDAGGKGPVPPAGSGRWIPEDDEFDNAPTPGNVNHTVLAIIVATVTLWTVFARPAAAAGDKDTVIPLHNHYGQGSSNMLLWPPSTPKVQGKDQCIPCDGFTAEELELLAPKQYHLRESVFVR